MRRLKLCSLAEPKSDDELMVIIIRKNKRLPQFGERFIVKSVDKISDGIAKARVILKREHIVDNDASMDANQPHSSPPTPESRS